VRTVTESDGDLANRYDYLAFGSPYSSATEVSVEQRYTYTGRESDQGSGLVHFRWRQLDPESGVFSSRDPLADIYLQWHSFVVRTNTPRISLDANADDVVVFPLPDAGIYAYARGNPCIYRDPYGEGGWTKWSVCMVACLVGFNADEFSNILWALGASGPGVQPPALTKAELKAAKRLASSLAGTAAKRRAGRKAKKAAFKKALKKAMAKIIAKKAKKMMVKRGGKAVVKAVIKAAVKKVAAIATGVGAVITGAELCYCLWICK
jgi:RHS repeat-associated protein